MALLSGSAWVGPRACCHFSPRRRFPFVTIRPYRSYGMSATIQSEKIATKQQRHSPSEAEDK